jgi:chromosome segregation ATPase
MNKTEAMKKLEEAGIESDVIAALGADDGVQGRIAALEAKIAETEGKASGILADKKKAQEKAAELQSKIDDLEGKDLGEAEKLQRELEREKSKTEAAEKKLSELETKYGQEKRDADLAEIGSGLKWLDSVPSDTRKLIISNELKDIDDLGNKVTVEERLKSVSQKYAGLLAADAPNGAGSKAGDAGSAGGKESPTIEKIKNMSDAEISADPVAVLKMADGIQT